MCACVREKPQAGVTPIGGMKPSSNNLSTSKHYNSKNQKQQQIMDMSTHSTQANTGTTQATCSEASDCIWIKSTSTNIMLTQPKQQQNSNSKASTSSSSSKPKTPPLPPQLNMKTPKNVDGGTTNAINRKLGVPNLTGCPKTSTPPVLDIVPKVPNQGMNYIQNPDGSHCIRTPGGRRININEYLMEIDLDAYNRNFKLRCPSLMNASLYDASRHCAWVKQEEQIDHRAFSLDLPEDQPLERFRQWTIMSMFRFFTKLHVRVSTIHYATMNLNRIVAAMLLNEKTVTQHFYAGIAMACIRMAIKHEETPCINRIWQNPTRELWEHAGFGKGVETTMTRQRINEIECKAVQILQNPVSTPPSPLDFLDRYLSVGGWPAALLEEYKDLAHYLIDLSLFAPQMDGLKGARPSLVAAAALMLAVKILNGMEGHEKFEYWPSRLEKMTSYSVARLTPIVRSLSALIRKKPVGEELLGDYHQAWSSKTWK